VAKHQGPRAGGGDRGDRGGSLHAALTALTASAIRACGAKQRVKMHGVAVCGGHSGCVSVHATPAP